MATVNKDFKIKSGLIVEGTTGTINGQDILTTSQASTDYIIDIIGGTTLVTSVDSAQLQVVNGELSVKDNVFDAAGAADSAESAANLYTDGEITTALSTAQGYANTAESNANDYTDSAISTEITNRNSAISTAKGEAIADANSYTDGEITSALSTAQGYANTAENSAKSYADDLVGQEVTDRNSAISTAITNLNLSGTYDALGAAADAEAAANLYTDGKVADLVDSAPALLDTLNELAAAIADNPNYASDVANLVAQKADTTYVDGQISTANTTAQGYATTAENNANSYADSLASNYDAAGSAATAQGNAEDYADTAALNAEVNAKMYADGLASNYDAAGSASTAETNANTFTTNAINALSTDDIEEGQSNLYYTDTRAQIAAIDLLTNATQQNITITGSYTDGLTIAAENGIADSTTDDLVEGETNLYFTDARAVDAITASTIYPTAVILDDIAKQVASTLSAATAGIQVGHSFAKADYRSAEFLVKVAYGTHTEISKVLLTLDTSDNIAITEYGIVGTNGSASTISADISGNDVRLLVTTVNNNSTVTVVGTLLV